MSQQNPLNAIVGYQQALEQKQALEQTGNDFKKLGQEVANTAVQLHPKRISLTVTEVLIDTGSTSTLRVQRANGELLPPFYAGQYINLFVSINGVNTARPYAISSSPNQRHYYDLTVKRLKGGFVSNYLIDEVKVGDKMASSGPMGNFYHQPIFHGNDLVFLAGGSGSAPARSMLLDLVENNKDLKIQLIYVNSYADDVIYEQQIQELAVQHQNITVQQYVTRPEANYSGPTGRLTAERLSVLLGDVVDKMFYICGPTPFNEDCSKHLSALGVASRRVRIEVNGAPKHPDASLGWPANASEADEVTITVQGQGSYVTTKGEPLLNSLERNGYGTENACRSGECSLCRVKVVSGQVFNPPEARLRKSDRSFGWIYSCVAFPLTDVELML